MKILSWVLHHLPVGEERQPCDDHDVKKLAFEANRLQQFRLGEGFQAEFDAWAKGVENEGGGRLEIAEVQASYDKGFIVFAWRVAPRPSVARRK